MDSPAALLIAAARLIDRGHAQAADARDARGVAVMPGDPTARTWSVTGALLLAGLKAPGLVFVGALLALAQAVGFAGYGDDVRDWTPDETPRRSREMAEYVWAWEDLAYRTPRHVLDALARAVDPPLEG